MEGPGTARLRRRTGELVDPARARALNSASLGAVPTLPGLYAIWILDAAALKRCGIAGPAPLLIYIGKAGAQRGLRQRLRRHVGVAWWDLSELLAVRGEVLFPWWYKHWGETPTTTRMLRPTTPLAELCERQGLDWQNKYLRYTWVTLELDDAELRVQEEALIRAQTPLLNRSAMPSFPPPQLRRWRRYGRARARWLWHTSWAGLLTHPPLEKPADWFGPYPQIRPGVDALGYPCRRDEATDLSSGDVFPPENLRELMRFCARGADASVREAIRSTRDEDELELWWGAHACSPLLSGGVAVEDSLSASLTLANEHEFPGPSKMPPEARCRELCKVGEKTFQRGYH